MKDLSAQMRGLQTALTLVIQLLGHVSEDDASLYSSRLFAFDDEVVNSTAYRQVLANAYARDSSTGARITNDATCPQSEEIVLQNTKNAVFIRFLYANTSIIGIGEGIEGKRKSPTVTSLSSFTPLAIDLVKEFLRKRNLSA
ncbi:hypothetical protein N7450_004142 [Penicillium hetheringtonii]|uniref:Uncharacterized protein n=1 Tax=Penicillium hetheringtonii TaxID=911720 RepID=A0AAD6DQ99_9EURO|nr:hypothetical protein N7450_004142 [Penicillium hetheringtonii]